MGKFVYLIRCDRYYKIGVANDVSRRLAELQIGNPRPLVAISCYEFDNCTSVEAVLHQKFDSKKTIGEWFELNKYQIREFEKVCSLLNGRKNGETIMPSEEEIAEAQVQQEIESEEVKKRLTREEIEDMLKNGWRIEDKPCPDRKGNVYRYYVLRGEFKKDGKRYRPTIFIGKELPQYNKNSDHNLT